MSQPPPHSSSENPGTTPARASRPPEDLLSLAPIPALLWRARAELSADFDFGKPMRVSRAPGRLDVMGGIADYTGSLVCEAPLDRAAAVLLQERADRQIQVFSFNLFDEHRPFTFRMPIDALADASTETLHKDFDEPSRHWAGYFVGCLYVLHHEGLVDIKNPKMMGINLAVVSDVPLGAGVSSSAAIEVATMMNLVEHLGLRDKVDPMRLSVLCQKVENHIVGAPCGIMDQVSSFYCHAGGLMRMICQPHELQEPLFLPKGIRAIGINSHVRHSVVGGKYRKTRCAAFMGHKIILEKMRHMGIAAGRELLTDPMKGYLANLDPDDYKKYFRPYIPEFIKGGEFLLQYGGTFDTATKVEPDTNYHVQHATDHHVLEAMRVRNFAKHLEDAGRATDPKDRGFCLDKAGHLMYASHLSYSNDAMLGAVECDMIVDLCRKREKAGIYGAKITGGGSGGTIAVLCDEGEKVDRAIAEVMNEYKHQTGITPEAFLGTSPGAWHVGTKIVGE